jgi:hypothetical protein
MPKVELDIDTAVAPERVRAALLDFSPRRPEIWPGIEPSLYEVGEVGPTTAEIKEGSKFPGGGVWAWEHYDFADPETVTWTVRSSNFCAPGSYVSATIRPGAGGGSRIHVTWNRTPTSFGGRVAATLIKASRGRPVRYSIESAMARLASAGARGSS